jgi:hypothetical protein
MLKIHSKVNTPYGEGILVSVKTEFNGLYVSYERTECIVWFGTENPGKRENYGGNWISREISLRELIELNKDTIRNEKLNELGI